MYSRIYDNLSTALFGETIVEPSTHRAHCRIILDRPLKDDHIDDFNLDICFVCYLRLCHIKAINMT